MTSHQPTRKSHSSREHRDVDEMIAALEDAPTGAPLEGRDYAFLVVTGIVLPSIILVWGWV